MPNYLIMRESEKQLLDQITSYFQGVVQMHEDLFSYLNDDEEASENKWLNDENYKSIIYENEKSHTIYDDILDDCMWVIQKNEPRASHLRFIVSLINSVKDLQRVSDYALSIAKFFYKRSLSKQIHESFLEAYKQTVDLSKYICDEFTNKYVEEFREELANKVEEYHKYLKNKIRTSVLLYSETNLSLENKTLIDLIAGFGALERTIEHQENVIKAFYYIKVK